MTTQPQLPLQRLAHWAAQQPDQIWLRQPRDRQLHDTTWGQAQQQVNALAAALQQLGLQPGDKVAILSKNCAEWFITDLALQAGGFISVPIYPTASADTVRYVLNHSGAKAIFLGKLDNPDALQAAIPDSMLRFDMNHPTLPCQYQWSQLLTMAEPMTADIAMPADLMTIIYTSGSTGNPKGALLTYGAYSFAIDIIATELGATSTDRVISYLPLAHITERSYIEGSALASGATVFFVESLQTFVEDVQIATPTLFLSVPRLWTVFRQNIIDKVGHSKLKLALSLPLIKGLVAAKIRKELGLDQARLLGCGSAPVSPALLNWYRRIGMDISEAWGMTENAGLGTLSAPFRADKIGTVGKPPRHCEIKLGDNQELLFKSPALFSGYYQNDAATAEAFDDDGFFRTGDQAQIDADGYMSITGRIKDNFKTAKGKYVAPVPIERQLAQDPNIELVCVIGSGQPYPVALIQLTEGAQLLAPTEVENSLQATIRQVNQVMESHATLGGALLVTDPWTVENEVLTPTLKIKRHVLEQRFTDLIGDIRQEQICWQTQ
ncbi:AMP-binding protein [uncultured Ferrimonas sp.]|uniref:AMP-binding protein n=1 Tax=uncultured Ferrimonas sp. TaxID=432640 RepID=UPI002624978E|nr:AMP-binding protein [uncultured Ferrimonas sp.]